MSVANCAVPSNNKKKQISPRFTSIVYSEQNVNKPLKPGVGKLIHIPQELVILNCSLTSLGIGSVSGVKVQQMALMSYISLPNSHNHQLFILCSTDPSLHITRIIPSMLIILVSMHTEFLSATSQDYYPAPRREGVGYCNSQVCLLGSQSIYPYCQVFHRYVCLSVCLSVQASTPLIVGRF